MKLSIIKKIIPQRVKKRIKKFLLDNIKFDKPKVNKVPAAPIKEEPHIFSKPHLAVSDGRTAQFFISSLGGGNSGSGAVLDFLREFNNCTVIALQDVDGGGRLSKTLNKNKNLEVDFIRHAGGLFELEQAFSYKSYFAQDAAIKRFITLTEFWYLQDRSIYDDVFMKKTREFIDKLVDFKITSKQIPLQFEHMIPYKPYYDNLEYPFCLTPEKNYTYYSLKDLKISDYRKIAKEYIMDVLRSIPSNPYLILDGFIGDGTSDYARKKDYVDNLKTFMVYRDPRDVYVTSKNLNCNSWVPLDVDDYIKWYKRLTVEVLKTKDPDFLIIRFEDLVLNYNHSTKTIMNFLGLEEKNHIHKQGFFDPSVSIKNIGLYKSFNDQSIIKKIEKELSEYCYYENKNI